MKIDSAFNSAVLGIQRGMAGLDRDAAQVASAQAENGESSLTQPLVDSLTNRLQVEASAKVAKTVDETLGSLFDDKA